MSTFILTAVQSTEGYPKERGIKKKDFLIDIITRALEAAEVTKVTETITAMPSTGGEEAAPQDEQDGQPETDEI